MSEAENREIARRYAEEVWGDGDVAVADEVLAEEQTFHDPTGSGEEHVDEFKGFIRGYHETFSDLSFDLEGTIVEGDHVAFWGRVRGTQEGEFLGIEPTGREIDVMTINVVRIDGGKIVERWSTLDLFGMLRQLGVDPLGGG